MNNRENRSEKNSSEEAQNGITESSRKSIKIGFNLTLIGIVFLLFDMMLAGFICSAVGCLYAGAGFKNNAVVRWLLFFWAAILFIQIIGMF